MKKDSLTLHRRAALPLCLLATALVGCGDRHARWAATDTSMARPFALGDAVAIVDPTAERVLMVTTDSDLEAYGRSIPIDRQVRVSATTPDRSKLFIVTAGDAGQRPPSGKTAQAPALLVLTSAPTEALRRYPLAEPFTGLALDPQGEWAVVYADAASSALVNNPNELLLVELGQPAAAGTNPRSIVLRSFGGRPQRFTFTDALDLPGGPPRRLLIVETEQDVALVDLAHPEMPEITIQLTSGQDARQVQPAGLSVTDGDAGPGDTRIAIRLAGSSSIVLASLVAATGRDFRPEINLTDVGGVPSDSAFVRTDGGALALAALVPARRSATLIDPATGVTIEVPLPADYQKLSLVTASAGATATAAAGTPAVTLPGSDVALLWSASAAGGIAFWELGHTAGQPYRAAETIGVSAAITGVIDVGGMNPQLKLLRTTQNQFFLLDLATRESSPFQTRRGDVQLRVSAEGDRAWAFAPDSTELSMVDLTTQHPQQLAVDREIADLFDIAATHARAGESAVSDTQARSLVAWNAHGNQGLTIYDARAMAGDADAPVDRRRNISSVLLEDLDVDAP